MPAVDLRYKSEIGKYIAEGQRPENTAVCPILLLNNLQFLAHANKGVHRPVNLILKKEYLFRPEYKHVTYRASPDVWGTYTLAPEVNVFFAYLGGFTLLAS